MPSAIRIFRLATALVTLALVAFVMVIGGDSPYKRIAAGGVLVFGAGQWFFLGLLARQFARDDAALAAKSLEELPEDG